LHGVTSQQKASTFQGNLLPQHWVPWGQSQQSLRNFVNSVLYYTV